MQRKIYVSPSDQTGNRYAVGNTNEAIQCRKIAEALVAALHRCGFWAMADYGDDAMEKHIADSNAWGADLHLPIHTNAFNGAVMGTRLFCYDLKGAGYQVCRAVMETLSPITPGSSDGIRAAPQLAEIRKVKAPTCYVEVGFHDSAEEAAWIIGNTVPIGEAICRGLCNYYRVPYVAPEGKTCRYDRLADVPGYARDTVGKLVEKGYLRGTGETLDLSTDMVRLMTVLDRAGAFGHES